MDQSTFPEERRRLANCGEIDDLPWSFALQEITGKTIISDKDNYDPVEAKQKWLDWWRLEQQKSSLPTATDATLFPTETKR